MAPPFSAPRTCPVLIGRDAALRSLLGLLAQAQGGSGGIALVTGEAGIGKSRLVAELRDASRAGDGEPAPTIVQGNCFEPDRPLPYAPLLDLLDTLIAAHPPTELAATFGTAAPELAKLVPAIARLIPDLAPTQSLDPEQEKRRLFQALARFFLHLAASRPLLAIIEDIHWCDDTSLEFFLYLARRLADAGLLLVFTYRSDEMHPALTHFLAMLDRERIATEYALVRLTPPQVEAMLRAMLGPAVRVRWDFAAMVFSLTEGNPFFIEEVAQSVEVAERGKPPVSVATALHDIQIPRSAQDAVRRRSAQLGEGAQELLRIAAVAGRRFDFALLQALTGSDEVALLRMIGELIRAQLVAEESADQFAFRHALTQQAIYGELLAREQRRHHRAIGETIERVYAAALDGHLADLAHHFYEAGAWESALHYTRRVGARALALHAPRAAVEHFARAIGAARELDAALPADLYRSRGLAYGTLGEFDLARSDHEAALGVARETGDRRAEWQSLMDLGDLWAGRDYARTGEFFRRAADLARGLDDRAVYARSLNRLANWLINTGQPAESLRLHDEALGIFTGAADRQGMAETFDLLGMANGLAGAAVDCVRHYTRAIELFQAVAEPQLLSSSLASRAVYASPSLSDVTYGAGGDPEAADRELAEALRLARRTGWLAGEAYAHWTAAAAQAAYGALGPALRHGADALRVASENRTPAVDDCRPLVAQPGLPLPAGTGRGDHAPGGGPRPGARSRLGLVARAPLGVPRPRAPAPQRSAPGGDAARRRPSGRRAAAYHAGAADRLDVGRDRPGPARSRRRIADRGRADRGHVGHAGRRGDPLAREAPGRGADALARFDEAEGALDAAARAATHQRARPLLWQVHRARGRLFHRWKREEAAARAYAEARAVVAAIAATLDDGALRDQFLATALATMPHERPRSARQIAGERYDGLTRRERDVAAQIALGKSNRAVAEALFLSERTVTTHVTGILGKLGFTSRAQIATWARAHDLAPSDA